MNKKSFTPLQTYKVLKRTCNDIAQANGFTPLQTYKVLKQQLARVLGHNRFTPLQTYKVLKPIIVCVANTIVLHLYKLTRFSNYNFSYTTV